MEKLKPCPFCGGEAAIGDTIDENGVLVYTVGCHKCKIAIAKQRDGYFWQRKKEAIVAWNRRSDGARNSLSHLREEI